MLKGEEIMIPIKSGKNEQLIFAMQLDSVNPKEVVTKFKITHEGVEYGFDAELTESEVIVNLPALDTIIPNIKNKDVLEAKIDAVANGDMYLDVWRDTLKIDRPPSMKAAVKESVVIEQKKPCIKITSPITTNKTPVKKKKKKENIEENINEIVDNLLRRYELDG